MATTRRESETAFRLTLVSSKWSGTTTAICPTTPKRLPAKSRADLGGAHDGTSHSGDRWGHLYHLPLRRSDPGGCLLHCAGLHVRGDDHHDLDHRAGVRGLHADHRPGDYGGTGRKRPHTAEERAVSLRVPIV